MHHRNTVASGATGTALLVRCERAHRDDTHRQAVGKHSGSCAIALDVAMLLIGAGL